MKKTYIAPKATVVEMETTSLMVNSDPVVGFSLDPTDEGGDLGGSRSNLWGED